MEIRFFSKEANASNNFHFHDPNEILLVMSEGEKIIIRGKVYASTRGSLFVLNRSDLHCSIPKKGMPYQFYSIRFYSEEVEGISTKDFNLLTCFSHEKSQELFNYKVQLNGDQLDHLLKLINKAEYYLSPDCTAYGKVIFIRLLLAEMLVYVNFLYKIPAITPAPILSNVTKIYPIIEYIQKYYYTDVSLDQLAQEFYISKYYLSRRFKEVMGISLSKYIVSWRLAEAKKLLRTGLPVNLVVERVGFNSSSHFIRTFTKLENITPKQYAKKYMSVDTYLLPDAPQRLGLDSN